MYRQIMVSHPRRCSRIEAVKASKVTTFVIERDAALNRIFFSYHE
jgi:hypothetical protein